MQTLLWRKCWSNTTTYLNETPHVRIPEELLDALRPELVLISCGYNSYGHPAPETLERLARREVLTYRTDTMGTVSIYVRGDGYAAQSQG